MRVKLHSEGNNILAVMIAVLAVINVPLWLTMKGSAIALPIVVTAVSGTVFLLAVNFFRSPRRCFKGDVKNAVVSAADGKIVALEEVFEDEYLHCRCIQLSVFMSLFNVHANWFPINGEVLHTAHHPGKFMAAYLPKSSTENERSTVVIKAENGQKILMRQIAGAMARRIVTYATVGDEANIEDHMGFIKFGSRVDLFLPLDTEIFARLGDKTIGGITLLGRLNSSPNLSADADV